MNLENLFLIDDASNKRNFDKRANVLNPDNLPEILDNEINIVHFQDKLGRQNIQDYPGWWRSFLFSYTIAQKYNFDKIIHIESDFYLLSDELINYITSIQSGWITLYSPRYQMPETAVQIICKDKFSEMSGFVEQAKKSNYLFPDLAERILPFSHVEKNFIGDRYGEASTYSAWGKSNKNPVKIDYIGQVKPYVSLDKFRSKFIF